MAENKIVKKRSNVTIVVMGTLGSRGAGARVANKGISEFSAALAAHGQDVNEATMGFIRATVMEAAEKELADVKKGIQEGTGPYVVRDSHTLQWMKYGAGSLLELINLWKANRKPLSPEERTKENAKRKAKYHSKKEKARRAAIKTMKQEKKAALFKANKNLAAIIDEKIAQVASYGKAPYSKRMKNFMGRMMRDLRDAGVHPNIHPYAARRGEAYKRGMGHRYKKAIHLQHSGSTGISGRGGSIWDSLGIKKADGKHLIQSLHIGNGRARVIYRYLREGTSFATGEPKMVARGTFDRRFSVEIRKFFKQRVIAKLYEMAGIVAK